MCVCVVKIKVVPVRRNRRNFTSLHVSSQDIGLQLIRVGKLTELSQLLSQPEYAPLRPALLLLGWDVYVAEGSGKELTEALWPSQVSCHTTLHFSLCLCELCSQSLCSYH